jgi:hypothetical protein
MKEKGVAKKAAISYINGKSTKSSQPKPTEIKMSNTPDWYDEDYELALSEYYALDHGTPLDEELEENIITSPKAAVKNLLGQLIEGKDQSYDFLVRSLQVLAKEFGLKDYENLDESDVQIWFNSEVQKSVEKIKADNKDRENRVASRVFSLYKQVYGQEDINPEAIDADFTTALWMLGNPVSSNKNIKIVRK